MNELKSLRAYYYHLLRMRRVELEISKRYAEGKMRCPVHLSVGQEAISAAFAILATKNDLAVSGHRGHTHYLGKGGSLEGLIAEIYGKATGCSKGRGGSMHLADALVNFYGTSAIVGNSIPVGVGLALAQKIKQNNNKVFVFLGDAATEEGVFYESINFAAIHSLPIVFICENNGFSVYSNFDYRQPAGRSIQSVVNALGVQSYSCDGMNPIETLRTLSMSLQIQEESGKPVFIEVFNNRYLEHCGPNDDSKLGYRTVAEVEAAIEEDPLPKLERHLRELDFSDKEFAQISNQIDIEIMRAFEFAESSPLADYQLNDEDIFRE